MKATMRMTLDGLIRALRAHWEAIADERADEARDRKTDKTTEAKDERRA